ncbi:hypothetical protein ABHN84_20705 [Shewanella vesiculosa]|uniref:DNA-binding protein n=1 Tax=Shewanella vesiculosa TaxID=518738 RepID=A0ABV0FYN3_9GAMM
MAKINLSKAAKLVKKDRTTLWRHVNAGKLSIERDRDGLPLVDTSELMRVYGELAPVATPSKNKLQHNATPSYQDLIDVVEKLVREQAEMKKEIIHLTHRLEAPVAKPVIKEPEMKPEDDPSWPKEIKTMSDVALRAEITRKYKKTT